MKESCHGFECDVPQKHSACSAEHSDLSDTDTDTDTEIQIQTQTWTETNL